MEDAAHRVARELEKGVWREGGEKHPGESGAGDGGEAGSNRGGNPLSADEKRRLRRKNAAPVECDVETVAAIAAVTAASPPRYCAAGAAHLRRGIVQPTSIRSLTPSPIHLHSFHARL